MPKVYYVARLDNSDGNWKFCDVIIAEDADAAYNRMLKMGHNPCQGPTYYRLFNGRIFK